MFIHITKATQLEVRTIKAVDETFVEIRAKRGDKLIYSLSLDKAEVGTLISELMECDANWPTEPPPEAPAEERTERCN